MCHGGIGDHDGVECLRGVHGFVVGELEQGEGVAYISSQAPVIAYGGVELGHLEVVGAVEQFGVELEARPVQVEAAAGYEFRRKQAREPVIPAS